MKKILFTLYKDRCHSLYRQFIFDPPAGYQYLTLDDFTDKFIFGESQNIFVEILNKMRRNFTIINIAKKNNIDIIYCTSGMLLFNSPVPWIIEFESVISFIIHKLQYWKIAKKILPFLLKQKNLKVLMPWTEAAANSLLSNIGEIREIKDKIIPVHLCLKKIDADDKKVNGGIFTILFVTTLNNNTEKEFYTKGGRILAQIFLKLKDKIPLRLILRSKIPDEFSYLKTEKEIEVYEECLPEDEFKKIFLRSNIFLFPCYQSPGLVFLDAMRYGLPIIATNIFSNPEMVVEGFNGFLINLPSTSKVNYLETEFGIRNIRIGKKIKDDIIPEDVVNEFCEKILLLYGNESLREKMATNSRKLLKEKFTIQRRNAKLKSVYDSIIKQYDH